MNAKLLLASIATTTLLSACGGDHAHVKAVDAVAQAEAAAKEKAPQAESITFDDHGKPTMGGVGGAKGANTNPQNTDNAETTAPEQTDTATENKPADTAEAKAEEAKPAEGEATAEAPTKELVEATTETKTEGEATATTEASTETKTN